MPRVPATNQDPLTHALAERLKAIWDAYLSFDAVAHNQILADNYRAVHPDGTVHLGKPTAEEIAAAPIEDNWLSELEAWPIGEEAALLTYTVEVEVKNHLSAARHIFAVGEAWAKGAANGSAVTATRPCLR